MLSNNDGTVTTLVVPVMLKTSGCSTRRDFRALREMPTTLADRDSVPLDNAEEKETPQCWHFERNGRRVACTGCQLLVASGSLGTPPMAPLFLGFVAFDKKLPFPFGKWVKMKIKFYQCLYRTTLPSCFLLFVDFNFVVEQIISLELIIQVLHIFVPQGPAPKS